MGEDHGVACDRLDLADPVHVRADLQVQDVLQVPVDVSPDDFTARMLRWVQPSPDGKRVLFQSLGYLWVRDVDGGEPERLTTQEDHWEFWPRWSQDGRFVVYTTWDDEALGSVRITPAP